MTPRLTYQTACVLQALAVGRRYGFDIMDFTGLASGTVYPILRSFEAHGWAKSSWEDEDTARAAGRPRRRVYVLTAAGRKALGEATERLALHRRIFLTPDPVRERVSP